MSSNTHLTKAQIENIQKALNNLSIRGANGLPLAVDGILGPNTNHAIVAFKKSQDLVARPYVGPITYGKLTGDGSAIQQEIVREPGGDPRWYTEGLKMLGLHERTNNAELRAWLRSDGATVGDPSDIPWCGDFVETAMRLALDGIIVPKNPYLAANWAGWGKPVEPQRGAILSFWRGNPASWQGHVGFYAGESRDNFYVLGGNQSNAVTISPLAKNRLRPNGSRWPDHAMASAPTGRKVQMSGGTVSTNEA